MPSSSSPHQLIGLLMDLNVPRGGFRHVSEFMTCRGAAYTTATGLPFPRSIPSCDRSMDTWKEWVKPLALDHPVPVADPPTSGRCWPLQSWARYIQSRPPLVDTIDWKRPLSFLLRGDAYPCVSGSWTQLSNGLLNHGARGPPPAYLSVVGIAVCGDKDIASEYMVPKLLGIRPSFFGFSFCVSFSGLIIFRKY